MVILTGAGLSEESGLGTFRDTDGLWSKYDLNEVATPEGFARNPALVHEFYNARRSNCVKAEPNMAHFALARLEDALGDALLIITQNVDDLHERAGSQRLLHMHGALKDARCTQCEHKWIAPLHMSTETRCPSCNQTGARPDIVWFGEIPRHMDRIDEALNQCTIFVAIGTSGQVYPAAGFVEEARIAGARTLEINLERTEISSAFDETRFGKATEAVPRWVDEVISSHAATRP